MFVTDEDLPSGGGHQTGVDLVKGLLYGSHRNETSITLDKYVHGRHSYKHGDKENMSVLWMDVLLQTHPLSGEPGGDRNCQHQPCATVKPIFRRRSAPYTDCQGDEVEGRPREDTSQRDGQEIVPEWGT